MGVKVQFRSRMVLVGGEKAAEGRDGPGVDAVVDVGGAAVAGDEARFAQDLEVVADGRLRQIECVDQLPDAGLTISGGDEGEQAEARLIGQGAERIGDAGEFALTEFALEQWIALGEGEQRRGCAGQWGGWIGLIHIDVAQY